MIGSNNEKTFICISFYIADEKLCGYETFFGEKSKNRDNLIQSGTPRQHTKNRDCPGKTSTVGMFVALYEYIKLWKTCWQNLTFLIERFTSFDDYCYWSKHFNSAL